MDTYSKVLKYSLDQNEFRNLDYEDNCVLCCDIFISYLELYKEMISNKVSSQQTKKKNSSLKKVSRYFY